MSFFLREPFKGKIPKLPNHQVNIFDKKFQLTSLKTMKFMKMFTTSCRYKDIVNIFFQLNTYNFWYY